MADPLVVIYSLLRYFCWQIFDLRGCGHCVLFMWKKNENATTKIFQNCKYRNFFEQTTDIGYKRFFSRKICALCYWEPLHLKFTRIYLNLHLVQWQGIYQHIHFFCVWSLFSEPQKAHTIISTPKKTSFERFATRFNIFIVLWYNCSTIPYIHGIKCMPKF